ncbi:hypothetical protein J9317_01105 [Metabacillus sp. KIGAM252]|uniref:YtxH domain-containing protein n=1 Tax=Metabacillus flavus TaxID=2823519 RepID=A0ABS5L9X8_9BACI|nr:GvpT/GvpP family gas vesicle accessory protein [Metabacillus flavus]MBS2967388.1 hypothetical protein [Metabacillus flavus]
MNKSKLAKDMFKGGTVKRTVAGGILGATVGYFATPERSKKLLSLMGNEALKNAGIDADMEDVTSKLDRFKGVGEKSKKAIGKLNFMKKRKKEDNEFPENEDEQELSSEDEEYDDSEYEENTDVQDDNSYDSDEDNEDYNSLKEEKKRLQEQMKELEAKMSKYEDEDEDEDEDEEEYTGREKNSSASDDDDEDEEKDTVLSSNDDTSAAKN